MATNRGAFITSVSAQARAGPPQHVMLLEQKRSKRLLHSLIQILAQIKNIAIVRRSKTFWEKVGGIPWKDQIGDLIPVCTAMTLFSTLLACRCDCNPQLLTRAKLGGWRRRVERLLCEVGPH